MIHHSQGLPLRFESRDHRPRIHAELNDLERDAPPDRVGLLGHINHATATLADFLEQFVAVDAVTFLERHGGRVGGRFTFRVGKKAARGLVRPKEFVNLLAQGRVRAAGLVQEFTARFSRLDLRHFIEESAQRFSGTRHNYSCVNQNERWPKKFGAGVELAVGPGNSRQRLGLRQFSGALAARQGIANGGNCAAGRVTLRVKSGRGLPQSKTLSRRSLHPC